MPPKSTLRQDTPNEFICPITGELMHDPVLDTEGNSYERSAITQWLQANSTSPITRAPLAEAQLRPNRALQAAIEAYAKQHHLPLRAPAAPATAATSSTPASSNAADLLQEAPVSLRLLHDAPSGRCLLSIIPPERPADGRRAAVDLVCVVDVSGSMAVDATVQDARGVAECHGLTVLDVVRHAVRTVSCMLGPSDRLAIVSYSDVATLAMPLTSMNPEGKTRAAAVLEALVADRQTNLWDGLHTGMELLRNLNSSRNSSVLLLTDGCPNVEPPRGHIPSLQQYYDKFGGAPPFTVNTFGFGYQLDSALLSQIAELSSGAYVFIPDSGLVGTVFVNIVANLLVTMASGVSVSVESSEPLQQLPCYLSKTSYGCAGVAGTVQFGQSRDIPFSITPNTPPGSLMARVDYTCGGRKVSLTTEVQAATQGVQQCLMEHEARDAFAQLTMDLARKCPLARPEFALLSLARLTRQLSEYPNPTPLVLALLKDLNGQVALSLDPANSTKWGRHYLPSLARANVLQQCNNFKDFSVQTFGGDMFSRLRDEGEAIFVKLPPPTSSRTAAPAPTGSRWSASQGRGGAQVARAAPAPAPVRMNNYYHSGGGCVAPQCTVLLRNGRVKRADQVVRGDVLHSGATVQCAVAIRVPSGSIDLVELKGGLQISPYHPVRPAGGKSWSFPIDDTDGKLKPVATEFLHNFVLDRSHVVVVNGVEMVSLGHGLKTNSVVAHPFFGTAAVVQQLRKLRGFDAGRVVVDAFTRDPTSHKVVGLTGDTSA